MYENFYHLKSSPFRLSPDPQFFFGSQGHKRALAYLRYGLTQKEGFIVITGAPGTGKTTLARALLKEIGREKVVVAELNTTHLHADDILRMVAASFGLEHENAPKATLLKRLETFFISRFRAGYHVLLLVDEAQNLPNESVEELRMLSNFYQGKEALIQIFLLGQEQFRESLYSPDMEQLRQRVVASSHLEPLTQTETKEYIEHRLSLVGWRHDPGISNRAYARIFTLTKGVPRRINTFCDRLFLFCSLENLHLIQDEHVKSVAKELMYEVSAKGLKLSQINPEEKQRQEADGADEVDFETLDTERLEEYSDDVEALPVAKPREVEQESKPVPQSKPKKNQEPAKAKQQPASRKNESKPLRVVSTGNTAPEHVSPLTAPDEDTDIHDNRPDWWRLVALAVDFQRFPNKHLDITSAEYPLPNGITEMFEIGVGKKSIPPGLRIDELQGLKDDELQLAIRNFIKKVLITNNANYYRRLGVNPDESQEKLRSHYKYLFRLLQPDAANQQKWDETYTRRINQAYSTLRAPEKRREYDEFLQGKAGKRFVQNDVLQNDIFLEEVVEVEDSQIEEYESIETKTSAKRKFVSIALLFILIAVLAGIVWVNKPKLMSVINQFKPQKTEPSATMDKFREIPNVPPAPKAKEQVTVAEVHKESKTESEERNKFQDPELEKLRKQNDSELAVKNKLEEAPKPEKAEQSEPPKTIATKTKDKVKETQAAEVISKPEKVTKVNTDKAKTLEPVVSEAKNSAKTKSVEKIEVNKTASEKSLAELSKTSSVKDLVKEAVKSVDSMPSAAPKELATESTPAPETVSEKIADKDIQTFVTAFTSAYEEGNLDRFMNFFSNDARTNDAPDRDTIRIDYDTLFSETEKRVIELKDLNWVKTEDAATGKGNFVVTVLSKGGKNLQSFNGSITLELIKINDRLVMKGMFHEYGSRTN